MKWPRRKPRESEEELGYFAEMIVRAIVDDYGITRVDIRNVTPHPRLDAQVVKTWNHRTIVIPDYELMRKIDVTARRRGLGWSSIRG